MNPKVSIIIPTYNNSSTIVNAVKSCLAQDYAPLEIIIVDDGSSDDTGNLVRSVFSSEIQQQLVTYSCQSNAGSGAARNAGIRLAKGDYIAFLDADDLLLEGSIATRANILTENPDLFLVFSDYTMIEQTHRVQERVLASRDFPSFCSEVVFHITITGAIFEPTFYSCSMQFDPFPVWTGAVMVRKSAFDFTGLFREDLRIANDYDMWIKILRLRHRVGYVNKPLAVYRHNDSTLTKVLGEEYYNDSIRCCLEFLASEQDHTSRQTLHRHLADLYFELGYGFWKQKRFNESHDTFLRALRHSPLKYKALKLYLATLIPHALLRFTFALREPRNE